MGVFCTTTMDPLGVADKLCVDSILNYWFGSPEQPGWDRDSKPIGGWDKKWFTGGPKVDAMIVSKFQDLIETVGNGKLDHWK